ncbi:MAG: hypothetical protein Roseis2KO_35940 [Roseivirga sp.]
MGLKDFFKQGYWIFVLLLAGCLWFLYAVREDTNAFLYEGRITMGRVLNYTESADYTQVSYAFYVNGELINEKRGASQFYKKGQYVYVLYLESDPEKHVILNNRKLAERDTILNLEVAHFQLSKQEVRDAIQGKKRKEFYR